MAKILKLIAAVTTARADARAAKAAHEADPDNRILRATYSGCISAVLSAAAAVTKADPKMGAKMTKVTEKYTQRKERMEESDEEEESVPASTAKSSEPESSEASSAKSSEEEESAAASMPTSSKPKPSEEEEEAAASEEEEEEAIAKGLKAAHAAYLKATKGTDAYGVFGPKGIVKALTKATGEKSVKAALGALAALPRKAKADAKVVADVAELKRNATREKIEAIVAEAKADGRASSKALRSELRAMGAKMGAAYLKGFVAKLPKGGRTNHDGARIPADDGEGNALGGPDDTAQARMMEAAMQGMNAKERADFKALHKERMRKSANGAAGRA